MRDVPRSGLKKQLSSRLEAMGERIGSGFLIVLVAVFWLWGAAPGLAGTVSLAWNSNSDADHYVVYWSRSSTEPHLHIAGQSDPVTTTTYLTPSFDAGTYYFAVKAFNTYGNSSDFSDWVSAAVAAGDAPPAGDDPDVTPPDDETPPAVVVPDDEVDGPEEETPPVVVEPDEQGPAFVVVTQSPGSKSSDGFVPETQSARVADATGYPTIQVLDPFFSHLFWLKSGWPAYNEMNGEARIAMGDVDNDGKDEMIVGFGQVTGNVSVPGGFFQILDDDYSHLAWGRVEWADYNDINGETFPACGDLNGDGKDEIIIGLGPHGQGYMEIFSLDQGVLAHDSWLSIQWLDYNDMDGTVRPVCVDIDGDGKDEIVAGLGSEGGDSDIPGGRFEIFGRQSDTWVHRMWGAVNWLEYTEMNGETWPAPGDLDGDGDMELAVGLGFGGDGQMALFEFQDDGVVLSGWARIEWPEYNDLLGETRPVCGDVDQDGQDEIILGWNTLAGDSENAHYFKVLSFSHASKSWENYMDSKSIGADIDSLPVKGAVSSDERITVGMMGPLNQQTVVPPAISPAKASVVGSDAGSSGCFIQATGLY